MSEVLSENLIRLSGKKADLQARLDEITPSYYGDEIELIEVMPGWEGMPEMACDRMREIVEAIPDRVVAHLRLGALAERYL